MILSTQQIAPPMMQTPCGLRGLGCSGQCQQCQARPQLAGGSGLGAAFYDTLPSPFNNPLVLVAIVVVVLILFGGLSLFGSGRKSSSRRRAKLRLIRAQAAEKEAALAAS